MNIRTEHLEALAPQQEISRKKNADEGGFAAIFARELQAGEGANGATTAGRVLDPLLGTVNGDPENGEASLMKTITGQTSDLLDSWNQYAQVLSSGGSQKNMWNLLSQMDGQAKALRASIDALSTADTGLKGLINELEVMNATERFKLNRGDYA